jgi:hypothetical protein
MWAHTAAGRQEGLETIVERAPRRQRGVTCMLEERWR